MMLPVIPFIVQGSKVLGKTYQWQEHAADRAVAGWRGA
jgi:hypothetical protein